MCIVVTRFFWTRPCGLHASIEDKGASRDLENDFKGTLRSVAAACGVSKSSVASWCSARTRERSRAKRGPPGLHDRIKGAVCDSEARNPLHNASQISVDVFDATGIKVSLSTVYKSLKLLNMSYKLASRCRKLQPIDR